MLQKSFSEGICVEIAGPEYSTSFKSACREKSEKSYCTSVFFVPKLIPKRTYLTVNGATENIDEIAAKASATYNRSCSLSNGSVKSYESSISIDHKETSQKQTKISDVLDGLKCFQNVELVPGLVMKDFSESVNIFPKTNTKSFKSNVTHSDCYLNKNYIVGLEVQKVREVELMAMDDQVSSFTSSMHINPEKIGKEVLKLNGECDDLL